MIGCACAGGGKDCVNGYGTLDGVTVGCRLSAMPLLVDCMGRIVFE